MEENINQPQSLEQSLINTVNPFWQPPLTPAPPPTETAAPPSEQPLEEDVSVAYLNEPRENLTIRKGFRLTPSAGAEIKKLTHFAYIVGKKGRLSPGQMPDETLTAYVNFAFDCARSYLEQFSKG